MRTTVRLNDELLRQAKVLAAKQNRSLTSIIEEGLAMVVQKERAAAKPRKRVELIVSNAGGGVLPGVDLTSYAACQEIMDADDAS